MQMVISIFRKKQDIKMLDRLSKADHADSHNAKLPVSNLKLPFQDACFPPWPIQKKYWCPNTQLEKCPLASLWHCLLVSPRVPVRSKWLTSRAHLSSPIKDTITLIDSQAQLCTLWELFHCWVGELPQTVLLINLFDLFKSCERVF